MNMIDIRIKTNIVKHQIHQRLSDLVHRNQIIEDNECLYVTSCDIEELEELEELEEEIFF